MNATHINTKGRVTHEKVVRIYAGKRIWRTKERDRLAFANRMFMELAYGKFDDDYGISEPD